MTITEPRLVRHLSDGSRLEVITHEGGNQTVLVSTRKFGEHLLPPTPEPRLGDVQWYVPYAAIHQPTVEAAPRDAIWIDVSASDTSYYGALLGVWERGETFALLEHDIICRPDVVEEFENCPEPWCIYGYADICHPQCMEAWANAMGCTRYRAELMEAVPDALSAIPPEGWDWHNLCDGLGRNLRAAGFTHHWHDPWVKHDRIQGQAAV